MLEEFEQNGYEISSINMSGGVSKIPLAAKVRADILGLPIHVLEEAETTALGAFILTLKARGKIKKIEQGQEALSLRLRLLRQGSDQAVAINLNVSN